MAAVVLLNVGWWCIGRRGLAVTVRPSCCPWWLDSPTLHTPGYLRRVRVLPPSARLVGWSVSVWSGRRCCSMWVGGRLVRVAGRWCIGRRGFHRRGWWCRLVCGAAPLAAAPCRWCPGVVAAPLVGGCSVVLPALQAVVSAGWCRYDVAAVVVSVWVLSPSARLLGVLSVWSGRRGAAPLVGGWFVSVWFPSARVALFLLCVSVERSPFLL